MRFIVQDDVYDNLPPDWNDRVTKSKSRVAAKVEAARAAAAEQGKSPSEIEALLMKVRHDATNAQSDLWAAAKSALEKVSHGKCWYCESSQDRSDKPVDHFRPKNNVVEDSSHPGYWWLAFDWKNFRYSCTYCNSRRRDVEGGTAGGKQDHFPIFPPPPYARSETDPEDRPKLLDPVRDEDVKLLTFLPNGMPHPAKADAISIERVQVSITLYHLNHAALVRRLKRLADDLSQHVHQANVAVKNGDENGYLYHKKEIIKRVRATSDYTSAARIYLQSHRTHEWVEQILSHDL